MQIFRQQEDFLQFSATAENLGEQPISPYCVHLDATAYLLIPLHLRHCSCHNSSWWDLFRSGWETSNVWDNDVKTRLVIESGTC